MARFELVIESGAGSGTKLPLPPDGSVTLGGGDDASLHLPGGPTMARYLVSLDVQPDGVLAKEVPGRGTIGINGKLVSQGPMKIGDRLRLGITVLRLAEGTGPVAVAPPPAAPAGPPGPPAGLPPRPRLPTPGGGGLPLPRPQVPAPMGAAPAVAPPPAAPAVAPSPPPAAAAGPAMAPASSAPVARPAPPVAAPAPAPTATASDEPEDEESVDFDLDSGESEELEVEMSEAELKSHREAQAKVERERAEAEIRARVRMVEEPSFVIADDLMEGADSSPDVATAIKSVPAPAITTDDDDFGGLDGPDMDTGLPRLDAVPTPKRPSSRPPAAQASSDDFDVSIDDEEEVDLDADEDVDEEESAPRPMPTSASAHVAHTASADSTGQLEAFDLEDVDPVEVSAALHAAPAMPAATPAAAPVEHVAPVSAPTPSAPPSHSGSIPASIDWTGLPTLSVEEAAERRDLPEGIPERLGDWELVRPIGQGAMATVYEAAHVESRVHAALKVLQPEPPPPPAIVERFVREQRINQQLLHPRIARCYAVGAARSWLYIAMEYVPGGDASDLVSPYSNVGLALRLGADLFTALGAGHAAGVIHRDVKPANLLLTENDAIGMPHGKLTDFGLAKAFSSGERPITRMGEAGGSLLMMAPEQLLNFSQAGPSADLYSAAATIYRLLTADTHLVLPCDFTDATYAQVGQAITEVARVPLMARRSDAPPAICLLIDMLVACDPVQRRSMTADGVAQQFTYWADMYGCGPVDG